MSITELKRIYNGIKQDEKLKAEDKNAILDYYRRVSQNSDATEVAGVTAEVIKIARLSMPTVREELFNAYLGLSDKFMDIGLLKAIHEAGIAAEDSEPAIRFGATNTITDKKKKDEAILDLIVNLTTNIFDEKITTLPNSAKKAFKKLKAKMKQHELEGYQMEVLTILEKISKGEYNPIEPAPTTLKREP